MPDFPPPVIVVAPDSFKGSISAAGAAAAMTRGARFAFGPDAEMIEIPMADGGEGTLDALLAAWGRPPLLVPATDALGRAKTARYGISADGRTGIIEAAEGNGLPDVSDVPLQPLRADSYGVGTIARSLLDEGVEEILLCIGGSASTDGGTGLLSALGVRFLEACGTPVAPGGGGLAKISTVDAAGLHPRATAVKWRVAVDVANPLCGSHGAAAVFGPQKGAGPEDVALLDAGLANLARVLAALRPDADPDTYLATPGFGAAGGLPLALVALLGAETVPGAELVADAVGLQAALARADVILTGEGCLDTQSLGGKVVDAVRRLAPAASPLVVVAGTVRLSAAECRDAGITTAVSLARGPATLEELTEDAELLIEDAAARACSGLAAAGRSPRRFGLAKHA
ncbi:glycerate kinase [Arthrobacter sp. zg-Y411]|uniref:glycerate kinase n=1 Tax=Arthrobacter zhangbolii TaxID=2886936 RepID=UPI001D1395F8|nr:glycerate kinase [Arthrobacter zhangbolii]